MFLAAAIPSLKFLPGSQHKVVVVDVISPSCFYAQPYGPDLVKLMKDLRQEFVHVALL